MLIHLSSHHNLAVVLYSLQSTPVIAFCVCGTLNGTIFAASIIFVHNFGVKKKNQQNTRDSEDITTEIRDGSFSC